MTIREQIEKMEQETLSPYACLSVNSRGRDKEEPQCDIRPASTFIPEPFGKVNLNSVLNFGIMSSPIIIQDY